jgi:hypothetical protein
MRERRYGALMKPDGEGCEDRAAIPVGVAVERFIDMLEAGLHRHPVPGQKRELRGMACESFEGGQPVERGELSDRVHPGVKVERGQPRARLADLGDAQTDFVPDFGKRIRGHMRSSVKRKVAERR